MLKPRENTKPQAFRGKLRLRKDTLRDLDAKSRANKVKGGVLSRDQKCYTIGGGEVA